MTENIQHIKNFFIFLEQKENREIKNLPIMLRFLYFPNSFTEFELSKLDLSKLDGDDIYLILQHQPQFIDRFDLSKLDGSRISYLLRDQPQFIDRFDLSKLDDADIYLILQYQPHLIDRMDLSKLDDADIFSLKIALLSSFSKKLGR